MKNIEQNIDLITDYEPVPLICVWKEYRDKFGKEPNIIGMFWNDKDEVERNLRYAIDSGVEYNEMDLLDDEAKREYFAGHLLF